MDQCNWFLNSNLCSYSRWLQSDRAFPKLATKVAAGVQNICDNNFFCLNRTNTIGSQIPICAVSLWLQSDRAFSKAGPKSRSRSPKILCQPPPLLPTSSFAEPKYFFSLFFLLKILKLVMVLVPTKVRKSD